jgi:hypothetical protein
MKNTSIRVGFRGKRPTLPQGNTKLVTGVCNLCRAVTDIDCVWIEFHHDENRYDKKHPLRYTIEICPKCHGKETWRLETIEVFKERKFNQNTLVPNFKRGLRMKQARNYYITIYSIKLFNTQFYLI